MVPQFVVMHQRVGGGMLVGDSPRGREGQSDGIGPRLLTSIAQIEG